MKSVAFKTFDSCYFILQVKKLQKIDYWHAGFYVDQNSQ